MIPTSHFRNFGLILRSYDNFLLKIKGPRSLGTADTSFQFNAYVSKLNFRFVNCRNFTRFNDSESVFLTNSFLLGIRRIVNCPGTSEYYSFAPESDCTVSGEASSLFFLCSSVSMFFGVLFPVTK